MHYYEQDYNYNLLCFLCDISVMFVCVLAKRVVSPIARPSPGTGKQSCCFFYK